jgi:hypothetical protein
MEKYLHWTRLVHSILLLVWLLVRIANEAAELMNKTVNYQNVRQLQKHISA